MRLPYIVHGPFNVTYLEKDFPILIYTPLHRRLSGIRPVKCNVKVVKIYKCMHGSILPVTIPHPATPGTSPTLRSQGWGIVSFCMPRGGE